MSKRTLTLQPDIGDWMTYRPVVEKKDSPSSIKGSQKLTEKDLYNILVHYLSLKEKYLDGIKAETGLSMSVCSISAEQLTANQILKELDSPIVQFSIDGYEDPAFICMDTYTSSVLIDRCTGFHSIDQPISKELTEIEKLFLESIVSKNISLLSSGLNNANSAKYVYSPNICFDQKVSDTSVYIVLRTDILFDGNKRGFLFLLLPNKLAKSILEQKSASKGRLDIKKLGFLNTSKIVFPITAHLGSTSISAKDLYALEEGDVIVLDNSILNLLPISIGEHLNLLGQPGIKENRLSFQILSSGYSRVEKVKESGEAVDSTYNIDDNNAELTVQESEDEQLLDFGPNSYGQGSNNMMSDAVHGQDYRTI